MLNYVLREEAKKGCGDGMSYPLRSTVTLIGRDPICDLPFDDDNLSRRHAAIVLAVGGAVVIDLKSSNGVFLNGERVEQAFLEPGDRLVMSEQIFTVRVVEAQDGAVMPPEKQSAVIGRLLEASFRGGSIKEAASAKPVTITEQVARLLSLLPDLHRCPDKETAIERALAIVLSTTGAERAYLARVAEDGSYVVKEFACTEGMPPTRALPAALSGGRVPVVYEAIEKGHPVSLADIEAQRHRRQAKTGLPCIEVENLRSCVAAPCKSMERTWAVLCAETRLSADDLEPGAEWLLGLVADRLAAVFERYGDEA